MATRLSAQTLEEIGGSVPVPVYDRSKLTAGIIHFGIGNFHRAHQAVYLDALFNSGRDHDWAIIGAGVMESDAAMRDRLAAQDYLTTVVARSADTSAAHVTGPMIDFLPPGDVALLRARMADPAIRIVSLTITEGGYFLDPASGEFNPDDPSIRADAQHPDDPTTVFGLIALGLKDRRAAGMAPFTVMSCDNIPHNGRVTRNVLAGLVGLHDPDLASWIRDHVAFPNAMVDRITPATSARERDLLESEYGIVDSAPVFCEDFKQWVLEDSFPAGRPALETVGVQIVEDVTPFEIMKIRILNGGHGVVAYPGGLLDVHFVHEAMEHPLIAGFFAKVERDEIVPIVPPVPDTDLGDYLDLITRRFANPRIGDTIRRICFDGSNRQPKFIIPTIADRIAAGRPSPGLALESALWCRYCQGTTESGATIEANDPSWQRLQPIAAAAKDDPLRWLAMDDIYGNVGRDVEFRDAFATALTALWSSGVETVLGRYIEGQTLSG